jgi:CDP-6-deoxy-D-xylo-4-hexulose-3-dehydrase
MARAQSLWNMAITTVKSKKPAGRGPEAQDSLSLDWPLMKNNITRADLDVLIQYLRQPEPTLTQSHQVRLFEKAWCDWLGVKHSVFVNSGASANLLTMAALRERFGGGQVIVPTLTWVSDIASVMQCGFEPVFADINPHTLGMNEEEVIAKLSSETRAVFITHVLGFSALSEKLLYELRKRSVPLIEDVCESHGATFESRKLGTFGLMSDFSFYYAHHMSTIEGGMVCTDDPDLYQILRMLRSHGMVREGTSDEVKLRYRTGFPDLNPDFIFAFPAYNVRSTEINAVLGLSQLKRLDENNALRRENFRLFLQHLDPSKYRTDFYTEGSCNYAFTLVLKRPDSEFGRKVEELLRSLKVEFRRGLSGGGNQLRQPYARKLLGQSDLQRFPEVEHVHFYGYYLGNYPELERDKILKLCERLNHV